MSGFGAPQSQTAQANLEQVPPMLQTEDRFTSLTHVTQAVLAMHGLRSDPDVLSAVTGDCFAVQVFPEQGCSGLAGRPEVLRTSLADIGLSANLIAEEITEDSSMRVFAIMRAGLRNARPCLACGGWEIGAGDRGERRWGVINRTHPREPRFMGSTVQARFVSALPAQDLAWPREDSRTAAVLLVEGWRDPRISEAALARRALQRGLSLIAGDQGFGGPGEHARLLHELSVAGGPCDDLAAADYPFPTLVAARCRLETMARFLGRVADVAPRHKRAACRTAQETAAGAARLLLDAEPPRAHPRSDRAAVEAAELPWPPETWEARARALEEPNSDARRREVALIEQLRAMHADLVEALDTLLAKA